MKEFRSMNGKETLEFLKANAFTAEAAKKAQMNEMLRKRRTDVLRAFDDYLEWLENAVKPKERVIPRPEPEKMAASVKANSKTKSK